MEVTPPEKPKKKQKHGSSKYYSSLATEVAAMNLLQADNTQCRTTTYSTAAQRSSPLPEAEPAIPSSDVPEETLPKGGLSESSSASDLEIMTENLALKQEGGNRPPWVNDVIFHVGYHYIIASRVKLLQTNSKKRGKLPNV